MSGQGHRTTLDRIFLSLTALFVLGGFMALGFLENLSLENRALVIMVSSVGIIGCLAILMLISAFWRRLRKWTWQRALASWKRSSQAKNNPKYVIPDRLSDSELRQLVIQIYSRMGYRITTRDEPYLRLINPDREIEVIACRQQSEPIALHFLCSLELEMKRIKAVRGFFWAPAGFTSDSIDWAVHRSIVLADRSEIGRLVDCARTKGSRLLEY